ncbi:MAG: glycosyltransferase family 39 protein [Candidatus Aenigmarchaeota archaeon]|nr:glycosyltransferase family 39 protein [Candidatus Aenigmarchaeota archaeon]
MSIKKASHKTYQYLALIIAFALILRLIFFIGFVNWHGDDGVYINYLSEIIENKLRFDDYRNLSQDSNVSYSAVLRLRPMLLYTTAFFFTLLGRNELATAFYQIILSTFGIILIFHFGKMVFDKKIGLLAAFLLAFYPLDVILATTVILPDLPLAFFLGLALFLFLKAEKYKTKDAFKSKKTKLLLLSGISIGLGYLIKPAILVFISIILFLYVLVERKFLKSYIFIVLGLSLILIPEGIFYYSQSGDFFLNMHLQIDAFRDKYHIFETPIVLNITPNIKFSYTDGTPIFYATSLFGYGFREDAGNLFGYFYYFVVAAIIFSLFNKDKRTFFIILWLVSLFLYLEFGPVLVELSNEGINYLLIFKNNKYTSILTFPALLLLSYFLININRSISLIIIIILLITSIQNVALFSEFTSSAISNVRDAAAFLKEQPKKDIWVDPVSYGMFKYHFGFNQDYVLKLLYNYDIDKIKDAYILDGGSRGVYIHYSMIENIHKEIISRLPQSWKIIKVFENPFRMFEKNSLDMIIYYAPQ